MKGWKRRRRRGKGKKRNREEEEGMRKRTNEKVFEARISLEAEISRMKMMCV